LHSDEQAILVNWYNSLTSKGTLNWNTASDLCVQTGVICDASNPQKVTKLYPFFFLSFFWCIFKLFIYVLEFNALY